MHACRPAHLARYLCTSINIGREDLLIPTSPNSNLVSSIPLLVFIRDRIKHLTCFSMHIKVICVLPESRQIILSKTFEIPVTSIVYTWWQNQFNSCQTRPTQCVSFSATECVKAYRSFVKPVTFLWRILRTTISGSPRAFRNILC